MYLYVPVCLYVGLYGQLKIAFSSLSSFQNISTLVSFSSPKMDGVDVSISLDCLTGGADQGEQSHQCRNVVVGQRVSPYHYEYSINPSNSKGKPLSLLVQYYP